MTIGLPERLWNPPNPYLSEHRELLGEPPTAELEIYADASRSILSENDSPDVGFRWSANPYRGCFHACAYCYARPSHEYLGLGAGSDFERKLLVKKRAPELLRAAFDRRSWTGELVVFSGVTDCYQPLEAAYGLTRACLEVCLEYRNPVGIITKSALIRRDAELLGQLAKEADATVTFSIAFLDKEVAQAVEPGTPTIAKRFETMEILARAGVRVGIGVAPRIPGLNDSDIPGLLKEAKNRGATMAFHQLLRLPGSVKAVFLHRLREALPLRAKKVESQLRELRGGAMNESRFGLRHRGQGAYWDMIEQTWKLWTSKLGFDRRLPKKEPTFRRPARALTRDQLELW